MSNRNLLLILLAGNILCGNTIAGYSIRIVFWLDIVQKEIFDDVANAIKDIEAQQKDVVIQDMFLVIDKNLDQMDVIEKFCEIAAASDGISIVLDFTYQRWQPGLDLIQLWNIPYLRIGRILAPFMQMFGEYLRQKDGNDVALVFQSEQDKTEAIYQVVEGYPMRVLVVGADDKTDFVQRLLKMRPSPTYYGIFARGLNMNGIFEMIDRGGLFERPAEWHFIFMDTRDRAFKYRKQVEFATKFTLNAKQLCRILQIKDVSYCSSGFTIQRALVLDIMRSLITMDEIWLRPIISTCNVSSSENMTDNNARTEWTTFHDDFINEFRTSEFMHFIEQTNMDDSIDEMDEEFGIDGVPLWQTSVLTHALNVSINMYSNEHEAITDMAIWQNDKLHKINASISSARRFFRISVTEAIPWSYMKRDEHSNEVILDYRGDVIWEGYCIDFIAMLSQKMNFEYTLVSPKFGKFGKRDHHTGLWDGIVGDLVSGETDFAVAPLNMYAEREEYIDYIAPYFEQTGISIVMRKPVRQTSLFKFLTVLRIEVWLSIVAALLATAFMIWLLDKYSPYSYRNNREAYPYPCREFTLRESLWFALTSFTPQGGGEAPKAVSGRILVAAYWLFVVLMLATFTANLAAFLTVERMQTPVASLDQLARQSRINYTVVAGSDTHQYFINMKFAEDTLYRMWKELALNASTDSHMFRVWDYPIKEQYGRILLSINASDPVKNVAAGFQKVNEHENADFAFIHDSSEIKYEITRNCNFTEVGEVFAEHPYAIAVQQGSHLANEFSYAILELQKDSFFEDLKAKYWNHSRLNCPLSEDQEGITLDSLGGVFIATLFGLGLAMVTLVLEVAYYKKKHPDILSAKSTNITMVNPVYPVMETSSMNPTKWWQAWRSSPAAPAIAVENPSPPPTFEAATFRKKTMPPSTITLGGEHFQPRLRPSLAEMRLIRRDKDPELPLYVE